MQAASKPPQVSPSALQHQDRTPHVHVLCSQQTLPRGPDCMVQYLYHHLPLLPVAQLFRGDSSIGLIQIHSVKPLWTPHLATKTSPEWHKINQIVFQSVLEEFSVTFTCVNLCKPSFAYFLLCVPSSALSTVKPHSKTQQRPEAVLFIPAL